MPRYFVTNADETAVVEVIPDPEGGDSYAVRCKRSTGYDLVGGTRESQRFEDALQAAARHADRCICRERF